MEEKNKIRLQNVEVTYKDGKLKVQVEIDFNDEIEALKWAAHVFPLDKILSIYQHENIQT
jgi:hypothetical protein